VIQLFSKDPAAIQRGFLWLVLIEDGYHEHKKTGAVAPV